MAFDLTTYIPNGLIVAAGTVAGWVFRDHAHRDDVRFKSIASGLRDMNAKLDNTIEKQSENHAEILKILLEQRRG